MVYTHQGVINKNKRKKMKKYLSILLLLTFTNNINAQSFECDNNFESCGTPEQSGGGGGGGSVLIANTDLGDTYQNADDFDDDGIEDNNDNCPRIRNRDQSDADGDRWGDVCDNCYQIQNEYQSDLDGDHLGDACDTDLDNDTVINFDDNCEVVYNSNQRDIDEDLIGDACDPDIDGDGQNNKYDECPFEVSSINQCSKDFDGDDILDYYADNLFEDNCPAIYNPEQVDSDEDGIGDECDRDDDNDSILDNLDNCPTYSNISQIDADKDGLGDECDPEFCYVVYNNQDECLNPSLNLQVYSPSLLISQNDSIPIRIFINRENETFEYQISILKRPLNSTVNIQNAIGVINNSFNFEYQTQNRPMFLADRSGEYQLRLDVINPNADLITGEINVQQTYDFRIVINDKNLMVQSCNSVKLSNIGLLFLVIAIMLFFQYKGNCHKR